MTDTKQQKFRKVVTPEFRVSFAHVFQPQSAFDNQEPKYSIVMLFPKKGTDLTQLKQLLQDAAREKWGEKIPKPLRNPIRDGDEKDMDGYKDHWFVSATSKTKPGLVDQGLQPILSAEDFYSGCYARATVTAFAYDKAGNRGIAFGLQNIQKLRDGEPFSGRTKPENDFDAVSTADGATVDTAGLFE